jgi:lysophospholipase L1-like esterase
MTGCDDSARSGAATLGHQPRRRLRPTLIVVTGDPLEVPARWAGRLVTAAGVLVVGTATLMVVELRVAGIWPRLPEPNFDLDRTVGQSGSRPPLRMVWLGDSTACGQGVHHPDDALPLRVAAGLDRPVEVRVLARGGARAAAVLRDQLPRLEGISPDVVLITVGANDASHLVARRRFARRYRELVRRLPDGTTTVLLGVPDMGGAIPRRVQPLRALSEWRGRCLDGEVRRIARDTGAVYVDIAGQTGPAFRRHRERLYAEDHYHPDDAGYRLWAEAVIDRLRATGVGG